jgi:hypothetical protein
MVRSRKSVRRKGAKRVTRKAKSRLHHLSNNFGNEKIKALWNHEKTLRQNYDRIGLAYDPNGRKLGAQVSEKPIHATKKEIEVVELFDLPLGGVDPTVSGKRKHHISPENRTYLEALVAKHGDDYGAMARDLKLNFKQHTRSFLKRRVLRLNAENAELAKDAPTVSGRPADAEPEEDSA